MTPGAGTEPGAVRPPGQAGAPTTGLTVLLDAQDAWAVGTPVCADVLDDRQRLVTSRLVTAGRPCPIALPPGDYAVHAVLPSGLTLGGGYTRVTDDPGHWRECRLTLEGSAPQPWLEATVLLLPAHTSAFGRLDDPRYEDVWLRLWARQPGGWRTSPPRMSVGSSPEGARVIVEDLPPVPCALQFGSSRAPWQLLHLPRGRTAAATLRPAAPGPVRLVAGVLGTDASADPVARALLGYLATGAARQAAMVADLIDPPRTWSQAAALGYHLVRTRRDPAAWPPEVLDRTADTPDGAVLAAWHRLERMRTGAESPSAVAARAAFVAAAQRDLPVCTDGLRILVEGMRLTRLAEPDPGVAVPAKAADPALAGALARCARYLAAADTTAPLLSYEGAAPDLPGPARPAPRPQDAVALDLAPAGALADPFDELFTRTFARGLAKAVMTTADLRQAEALVTEVYARGGRRPAASAETGFYRALDKAAWQTGRRWRSGGPTDLRFTPPRDATAAETGAALRTLDAVTRLPRGQRVVTEMAFVQGLAEDEIARELAVPRGVATAYLRRARRTLRKLLGGPVTDAAGPAAAADRHLQGTAASTRIDRRALLDPLLRERLRQSQDWLTRCFAHDDRTRRRLGALVNDAMEGGTR
ncbi:sigma factor-like helix-turn-helix DNA-binding protein [Streptomyces sp. NBC_01198]|uniref:sigma factor-like helix-turn-helix DNA-binding protein n=1 Tax=Streptomyces sp. NBC_01198 TaxID=2903769 RepID=UPI002E142C6C|nr:hypothetical protein OG702_00685 [Streptomyces sp. NBC_01198]